MSERLAQTRANQEHERGREEPAYGALAQQPPPPDVKHCWYTGSYGRQPALLLKWKKISPHHGWQGYIAVVAPQGGSWDLVTQWVSAALLEPVEPADKVDPPGPR